MKNARITHLIMITKNYLFISDESPLIKKGDWYYDWESKDEEPIFKCKKTVKNDMDYYETFRERDKIIAHLPLNDAPILNGVDLLPTPIRDKNNIHLELCGFTCEEICELKEDGQKHEYQKHIINSKGHKEWVGEYYYEPYMIEKK
jgi:hypothetical protein